jgi:hypothetical protein
VEIAQHSRNFCTVPAVGNGHLAVVVGRAPWLLKSSAVMTVIVKGSTKKALWLLMLWTISSMG